MVSQGTKLGDYVLLEKIGEGGFSEVWKAEHSEIPATYAAVKVPTDPDYTERLRREASLQHSMDHDNIIKVVTVNTSNSPPYMVMELMDGSLDDVDHANREEAAIYMTEILKGLASAHGKGIAHGDMKPANVLYKQVDKGTQIKVSDFGLGTIAFETASDVIVSGKHSSATKSIIGSIDYMAPELRKGEKPTPQSDVYACGVMYYRFITNNTVPILLPAGLHTAYTGKPLEPESEIIKKALRKVPHLRYTDASEMLEDIRNIDFE